MKNDFATLDEIKYAEKLLLPEGKSFEEDKVKIIQCNESKPIKACPGSGKTTTLLAKLAILANRMPLENNQGICVLTHTNVAIDEIKSKLGHKSDILFSYPNHFGTIQSFVDKFLAIPALKKYYQCNVDRIDNDLANERLLKSFRALDQYSNKLHGYIYGKLWASKSRITKSELQQIVNLNGAQTNSKIQELISKEIIEKRRNSYFLKSNNCGKRKLAELLGKDINLIISIYQKKLEISQEIESEKDEIILELSLDFEKQRVINGADTFAAFNKESGKQFLELKEVLFKKGILSYRDAYDLSNRYLHDYCNIATAFCNRYKYVFIDEMQDTYKHQFTIIDKIFDSSQTVSQYFGDPRQSIYNSVKAGEDWQPEDPLQINKSKRFGKRIAEILRTVRIEPNEELNENEEINSLKPYLIIYDRPRDVLSTFCELISMTKIEKDGEKKTAWELATLERRPIKAVGWVGEPNVETRSKDQLTIRSYFPSFRKNIKKKEKVDYDSIKSFLKKQNKATVKDYSDNIIRALVHILAIEKRKPKTGSENRHFTKTKLLSYLKESKPITYSILIKKLATWSRDIHLSDGFNSEVLESVKEFIKGRFFKCFKIEEPNKLSKDFFENDPKENISDEEIKANNTYIWEINKEIHIELGTIHSVKGETHIATLLLETSYYEKHESQRIIDQLVGIPYSSSVNDSRILETLKMAYVAMSRPKYLLCMAIKKERIQAILENPEKKKQLEKLWEVRVV